MTNAHNMRHAMPFKNLFGTPFFKHSKTVNFSTHSDWIHHNQLFQRHPRLKLLESQCRKTHHLEQILSYVFVSGLHRNPFVMSKLLYLSLIELEGDKPEFGVRIFNSTKKPNIFSWNTMIRFFAGFDPVIALSYYSEMLKHEAFPDKYTFTFLLSGPTFDLCTVQQVHCHILKLVSCHCLFVENSLISSYLACCDSETIAQKVFDEMPERDVVTWTCLISGLVSQTNYSRAHHTFKELLSDETHQIRPNVFTIISTMSACAGLGSTNLTKCFHSYLEKSGWLELDISVFNSVMNAYAKCGDLFHLKTLFNSIQKSRRDLYSWTTIISGYAMLGEGSGVLKIFSQMEEENKLIPDDVTFVAILSACAHSGLVEEGLLIFESVVRKYGIKPNLRHYGCIVDLLGRAGMVLRAYDIVENMPMEPNLAVLGSLLSGCRLHNNLDIGKCVLRKIVGLKERGGTDVLLSNIYANENCWSEVMEIRKEMRGKAKGKPPGRSWIQIKDEVHEFIARNECDGHAMELHVLLEGLEKVSRV